MRKLNHKDKAITILKAIQASLSWSVAYRLEDAINKLEQDIFSSELPFYFSLIKNKDS